MSQSSVTQKALDAFKSGQDPLAAAYGDSAVDGNNPPESVMVDENPTPLRETLDEFGEENLSPSDEQDNPSDEKAKEKALSTEDKETIFVTDNKGRRRKVEIDYSDKARTKKAYEMLYGARKWQAERDQAINELKSFKEQSDSKVKNWDAISSAYEEGGVEGLINFIEGDDNAYASLVEKAIEEKNFLAKASPAEIAALEAQKQKVQRDREIEKLRKEMEEMKSASERNREEAELKSLESQVHPVFDKYRFSGKLGDEATEHRLDRMLWREAMENLEQYGDDVELTPSLVAREFKKTSLELRKFINKETEKKVNKTIKAKKESATEHAQASAMKGYQGGALASEARDMIRGRNLTGLLQNWGKYGKIFGDK